MTRARDVANIDGLLTTTGDTYYASAAGTPARLGIGSTSQVLTVAAGVPSWATPSTPSSGLNLISTTAFTSVSSVSLATNTFTSTYKHYRFLMTLTSSTTSVLSLRMRTAGADLTSASYQWIQQILTVGPTRADANNNSDTSISFGTTGGGGGIPLAFGFDILNPQATDYTWLNIQGTNSNTMNSMVINGYLPITNSFDAFTLLIGSGTITGTIRTYGYGS